MLSANRNTPGARARSVAASASSAGAKSGEQPHPRGRYAATPAVTRRQSVASGTGKENSVGAASRGGDGTTSSSSKGKQPARKRAASRSPRPGSSGTGAPREEV